MLLGAKVAPLAIEGKVGGIAIRAKDGETVTLAAPSLVERDNWIFWLTAVAAGKALLFKSLSALGKLLGMDASKRFSLVCNEAELTKGLIATGYTADRVCFILYVI